MKVFMADSITVTDSALSVPGESVRFLIDLGYVAAGSGLFKESEQIFEAARLARPQNAVPLIGKSILQLCRRNPREAARILIKEALPLNSETETVKSFLGLVLAKMGLMSESSVILREVIAGENSAAVAMANALLSEIEGKSGAGGI